MKAIKAQNYLQVLTTFYCIDEDNFEVSLAISINKLSIKLLKDCFQLGKELITDILFLHQHLKLMISSKEREISINFLLVITPIAFYLSKSDTYFPLLS